jgi:hypothetical protein
VFVEGGERGGRGAGPRGRLRRGRGRGVPLPPRIGADGERPLGLRHGTEICLGGSGGGGGPDRRRIGMLFHPRF